MKRGIAIIVLVLAFTSVVGALCVKAYLIGYDEAYASGLDTGQKSLQQEAVNRGHAHWTIADQGTPELVFEWNQRRMGEVGAVAKVDLRGALRNALQLVMNLGHSKEEVIKFFQDRFDAICDKHEQLLKLPGIRLLKEPFKKDIAEDINTLINE